MTPFSVLFRYYFRRNHGAAVMVVIGILSLIGICAVARDDRGNNWPAFLVWLAGSLAIVAAPILWYHRSEDENLLAALVPRRSIERARLAAALTQLTGLLLPVALAGGVAGASAWYLSTSFAVFPIILSLFSLLAAADTEQSQNRLTLFLSISAVSVCVFGATLFMDALFAGVFAALVSFLLLSFILGFSNSRKESENPEDEILQQEMCLDGETERPTEPLLAGQRMELFPSTITTAELVSDEVEAIEEHTSPRDLEGEFQYEEPTRRKKFDGAKLLLKLTGVRWGVFAPFLVIMGLESPSPGSSWLSVLLVAALLVLVRDRGSLVAITSPHILLAPTRFRIGAFHRLVLPGVLAFVVVVLSAIVPLPARWSHFNVRASTYRLSESEPMTAMLRVGRESLYLTSGSEDSKEAPSVDDINEYVVATEIDDAYVIRQAATLVWNKYGVDGVSLAKTSSEPGTWKFSLSDDDRARVDSAASKGRVVPLAVGLMVFLTVIWVFPRSRKPESTDNGVITWLRRKVASLPVLVGLAVYAAFSATQEDTIRWILGLDLTPSGDIARSNWGYVHAFVNDHWTALIAISAALCAFLYWRALRGFLMTDITGASPVRWPWKRGEAGRDR